MLYIKSIVKSKLVLSAGVYTFFSFLNASIPFLLLPLLTTYLSQSDYGIVSMYQTLASFLLPFITVNASAALYRIYFKDKSIVPVYMGNAVLTSGILYLIFSVIILFFRKDFSTLFEIPEKWILTIPVFCFLQLMPSLILGLFQVQVKPTHYGVFQVSQTLINAGVSVYLITVGGLNWEGRILGILMSYIAGTIGGVFFILKFKQIRFKFYLPYIKHLLKFGGGLILHVIGAYLISLTSRILLTKMVGLDGTGLYSAGFQVACVIGFLTLSFNNAFAPWLFSNLNLNQQVIRNKIVKVTYLYYIILILICSVFYFSLDFIYGLFINAKFNGSIVYTSWILIGMLFQGMYYMVTNYITYSEKTYLQAIITFIAGLFNVLLTYFFIKLYGGMGAAISYALTFFVCFLLSWIVSQRVYPMPWFSFNKRE